MADRDRLPQGSRPDSDSLWSPFQADFKGLQSAIEGDRYQVFAPLENSRVKNSSPRWLLAVCCLVALSPGTTKAADANRVDFRRDIRPILSDKCFFCHGPDEKHRKADLRIDSREGMFEHDGENKIVVAGKPDASELWRRIAAEDPEEAMPPAESNKSLSQQERELIRRWIEQGAEWKDHWAYVAPVRPATSAGIADASMQGDIDRLIRTRLKQEGLTPSPAADARTLIRRLSFDLTGLPPTREDADAFEKAYAENADTAIGALVERLLASPQYGERMAAYWLDLVRYADTVGYHGDQEHNVSPYRDYVIQAFNDNMRFDQFTREQLAGDLLPEATVEQKIAAGYNRLLQTSHEGGVQQKEYLAKYSSDRVRNFGSVWLGATLQCCECHDHKFDPLPQRDFYRIAAFFADIDDLRSFKAGDTNPTKREPELEVTTKLLPNDTRRTLITIAIEPRPIRILSRGDWMDDSGEIVEPGVPAIFKQLGLDRRATRLDLANWVTSSENPVTARVFVNRLWKLYFGKGLAGRLDDFGAQGEAPVHPELLDWLAIEFMESGWDTKHMIRLMVLSQTYRQSSVGRAFQPDTANQEKSVRLESPTYDLENRLLARQSRWRLDAEMIRDNALAVSGLLNRKMGGRSNRPYQPDDYYQFLNFPKRTYKADSDDNQYRRALYTHWQRAYLHPMLKAFDAPSREECTCERPQSITPQSALVLLNDVTFIEAARVFAVRILHEGGASTDERLRWAWQVALSRSPTERELTVMRKLLETDRAEFAKDSAAVDGILKVGLAPVPGDLDKTELVAWTSVARTIFNLNEFMTRN